MIREIVSYLTLNDTLYLCSSKLFLPCLVHSPWFISKIKSYLTHLLGTAYSKNRYLFIICALHPVVVNNEFYFSVDFNRLPYFKKLLDGEDTIFDLDPLTQILNTWNTIFHPSKKLKKTHHKIIHSFTDCHNLCPCLKYLYTSN